MVIFIFYVCCTSFSDNENENDVGETTEIILEGKKNPLMVDLVDRPDRVKDTVDRWFDKEEFSNAQNDEDLELDLLAEKYEKKTEEKKGKYIFISVFNYLNCYLSLVHIKSN